MDGWLAGCVLTLSDGNVQVQGENETEKEKYVYDFIHNIKKTIYAKVRQLSRC